MDLSAFARSGGRAASGDLLLKYERLTKETQALEANSLVNWTAQGELRAASGGTDQIWLHVTAAARVVLTCQRCLLPLQTDLQVTRSFRFVANEVLAEAQDETSEEDVLALQRDFDLRGLIEDELLMDIPIVPRHDVCPVPVKLAAADADFEQLSAPTDRPFDVLARLRLNKPG